mmetsp:Transcript_8776/g.17198  ORF Transcript_8776/g.17198 Transcript_8776/m.17198 type:complete len:240 (-) Transcript_8776:1090-1809(-)
MAKLPFLRHNFESNVFIRWTSFEGDDCKHRVFGVFVQGISRSFGGVNKVGIKDVEFVALDNLRRRIFLVVVRLVVFVPFESCPHPVEVARFARSVLIMPPVCLFRDWNLRSKFGLVFAHTLAFLFQEKLFLRHGESSHACGTETFAHVHIIATHIFTFLIRLGALLCDLLQNHFSLARKLLFILVFIYYVQPLQVVLVLYQLWRVITLVIITIILFWSFILFFVDIFVASGVLLFPKLI